MTLDQARQFLISVGDALGRKPILYCGGLFKSEMGDAIDVFFGSHRLWLAQYGANRVAQASWNTYWLWQYTDSLTGLGPNQVDGIPGDANGNLDCNSYGLTKEQITGECAS
jgi:GH25 family lysozyme M1 (1,4-beta-N-acetylmuramidase)